jgi:hypothetical protein
MKDITVRKTDLLATLKTNREQHRRIFEEAQAGYRAQVIAELDTMLAEARNGGKIRRYVRLAEPVDQTSDYDRAIAMLEFDIADQVVLSETDFTSFVLDNWHWKRQFLATNAAYSVTAGTMAVPDDDD